MDKKIAFAHGQREYEKAQFIAFLSAYTFYVLSDLPFISFKFLLFIPFELVTAAILLAPVYILIPYYRSKVKEDTFNITMAILIIPLILFTILVGYITVQIFEGLVT